MLIAGWVLNIVGIVAHSLWADKDPTHEDVVGCLLLVLGFMPYLVFIGTCGELFTQRVLHRHHGIQYSAKDDPYTNDKDAP